MIKIKNASFRYSRMDSGISGVNLDIEQGECVLLCGRSGCGKTTLTRLVNGLIPHFYQGDFSGEVEVAGHSVIENPLYKTASRVGSVFQNPKTQFFNIDTDAEIVFSLENAGVPADQIRARLEQVVADLDIQKLQNRSLFELSGGEKQKIAFASAYAFNPRVVVLDEPSANLDTGSIRTLEKHLGLLKKQGTTILIAEHRLYYLMGLADRVVYMENGRIASGFSGAQFQRIPATTLADMGLRGREPVPPWAGKNAAPAPAGEDRTLVVDKMRAWYKKTQLFRDIGFTARAGEVIGIIGPNGAGKSTFLRTLAGLHKKQAARITWKGRPANPRDRLAASYLVMQDTGFQLFAESVSQECVFGLKHPDRELARQTLENLDLSELGDRHPHTLSGGQKQRLAIAAGLVCGKQILLFDEPTSGLDHDGMVRVRDLFYCLAGQNRLILVVSHDYEFIASVCSRIFKIDRAGLVQDYLPQAL